jgi:hypothetical protein
MKKSVGGTDTVIEVGAGGGIAASFIAYEYTATANQTTFSGSDNNSNTLAYNTGTPPSVQVFMNGILLDEGSSQDYTGTNGTSVVLTTAADAGDLIQIHAYKSDVSIVSDLSFADNQKLKFGDSQDLQIWHGGVDSYLTNDFGHLQFIQKADDKDIQFIADDGTGGYTQYMSIDGDEGRIIFNKWTRHVDNARILVGTGGDLAIYHDGSNSYIADQGTGVLNISGSTQVNINAANGENGIQVIENAGVRLRHNNIVKLDTTSTGIDVTGEVQADSLDVDGLSVLTSNNVSAAVTIERANATSNQVGIQFSAGNSRYFGKGTDDEPYWATSANLTGGSKIVTAGNFTGILDSTYYQSGDNISVGTISAGVFTTNANTGTFSNSIGTFPLVTSTPYDYVAKFESTDSGAAIIIEDNNSTTNGNRVSVSGDTMSFFTAATSALTLDASQNATFAGTISSGAITSTGTSSFGGISLSGGVQFNGYNANGVNQINGTSSSGWLDFNMDTDSVYPQSTSDNQTVLGSVTHMNFVGDSNGNGTGGRFYWGYGTDGADSGTFTTTMDLDRSGNLTTVGKITSTELEITGGAGNTDLYIRNTSPTLGFTDTNSFTDSNDIYMIRGLNNAIGMQWYDNSANTTTTTFEIDSAGNTDITGSLTATGLDINGNADISGVLTMSHSAAGNMLNMNNNSIIGVNSIVMADPGPSEGVTWSNIKIYESPDDLTTNSAGNFQVTYSNTRKLTVNNNGIDVNGTITTSGTLYGPSSFTIDPAGHDDNTGTVIIAGNLQVDGTTTTINSTTLDVDDLNITLAKGTTSSGAANGAGILVEGPSGGGAQLVYESSNDRWTLNKEVFSSQGFMIGTTATDVGLIKNSSGVFDFQAQSAREISFSNVTNGEHVRIDADGKVGIGTDDPLAPLDVVRGGTTGLSSVNARTALLVQNNLSNGTVLSINAKNTGYSGIFLGDQDNEAICQIQYVHTNDKLKFLTNGGGYNPLTISGQNVGIGTDSPSSILDVAGSAAVLTITDTRDQTFTVGDTMCSLAFDSDDTSGGAGTASHPRALISLVAETTFGSSTGLSFSTKQDTTTAPTEKMRINTAGDVGIGITSPDAKLRIDQNAIATGLKVTGGSSGSNIAEFVRDEGGTATVSVSGYSSNPQMNFASTGNTFSVGVRSNSFNIADHSYIDGTNVRLAIDNTGKVGIGTSAPTTKFQIVGSTNSAASSGGTLGIRQQGDGVGDGITITSSHSNSGRIYKDASGNLCFYNTGSSSTTDFVIENVTGNIGIGAADPKAQLQVKQLGINVNQSSVTSTSQYTCDSMSASDFRSARYTVQVTNTTDSTYQITEILLIHDGTTPSMTEYGTIFTGSAREASFDADISTGNVRLLATPASTDSMQFKVVRHSILV